MPHNQLARIPICFLLPNLPAALYYSGVENHIGEIFGYYPKVRFPAPYRFCPLREYYLRLAVLSGMTVPCPCLLLVENTVLTITHGREVWE